MIDIKRFTPKIEIIVANPEPESIVVEASVPVPVVIEELLPNIAYRKKRSQLPLNVEDYEKRRSARSVRSKDFLNPSSRFSSRSLVWSPTIRMSRSSISSVVCSPTTTTGSSLMPVNLPRIRMRSSSSDEETEETVISPDNVDEGWEWHYSQHEVRLSRSELAPSLLSEVPKDNFPLLQVEYKPFFESLEEKTNGGRQYHHIDLLCDYLDELTKHSSTLWSNEMRTMFTKLFDSLLDYVQYPTSTCRVKSLVWSNLVFLAELQSNHLRACLSYVEIALGASKSDLSEDSIERYRWPVELFLISCL